MVDAILTYAIVAVAAGFLLWRVILPARARSALRKAGGADAACASESAGACGGCSGCPASKAAKAPLAK